MEYTENFRDRLEACCRPAANLSCELSGFRAQSCSASVYAACDAVGWCEATGLRHSRAVCTAKLTFHHLICGLVGGGQVGMKHNQHGEHNACYGQAESSPQQNDSSENGMVPASPLQTTFASLQPSVTKTVWCSMSPRLAV